MMISVVFLALLVSCMGQESSSVEPESSTTAAPKPQVEKEGPRNPQQAANPRPFRNYAQPPGGNTQGNQPANPSYQPRRLSNPAQPRYDSPAASIENTGEPVRENPVPLSSQPNFAPRVTATQNEPQAGPVEYRHQPANQPRRISSADQTHYQSRQPSIPDEFSYKPYAFNYVSEADDGYYSHQQSADDTGKVIGSYSFALEDGRKRVVEYIADQNGFRANIDTNEPGTSMEENPADVVYYSAGLSPVRPAGRSFDDGRTRADSGLGRVPATQRSGISVPAYPVRPGVNVYQGAGVDPATGIRSYQGSEDESGSARSGIQNYGGQGVAGPRDPISGIPRGPAYTSFQGSRSQGPSSPTYRTQGLPGNTGAIQGSEEESGPARSGVPNYGGQGLAGPRDGVSGIPRGPAYTSFLGSRSQGPSSPTYRAQGLPDNTGATDDVTADDAPSRDSRGYQSLDPRAENRSRQPSRRLQPINPNYQPLSYDDNVPVPDYHVPHHHGAAPYYYYRDNGNYWYHRH